VCAYVCPSHIPLIQYFRQEKAKIWEIKEKAKKAEEAKIRFEAKQARMEREEQERKARSQRAAEARREELAKQKGEDPVKAALERLKAKQAGSEANKESQKTDEVQQEKAFEFLTFCLILYNRNGIANRLNRIDQIHNIFLKIREILCKINKS